MLTKLSMRNFRSFMEKNELDLNATGYEILDNINKTDSNVLKGALIVGGNATGKSTVLDAIKILLELLVLQINTYITKYVCLFKNSNQKAVLEYEFLIDGSKIKYKLEFGINGITKENLSVDNKEIIYRIDNIGVYVDIRNEEIKIDNLQQTQSAIRKIYFDTKFIDNAILQDWFKFLEGSVYINQSEKSILKATSNLPNVTYKDYFENNGTDQFNEFLEEIKYNQYAKYTNEYYNDKISFRDVNNNKEIILIRKDIEDFGLPLGLESIGNQTLVNIMPYVLEAMSKNSMIIIDEFSSGLHNMIEEAIIRYFMKNSKRAQLFIVSHSTNLLTNTLLRPDQIYTVDFIKNKGSKLNRVSDKKPREAQNLEKMYLSGVFDGIPDIK